MDSLALQALVSKLSAMAATGARVAAGASAAGPAALAVAAASGGAQRGLRTAAAVGSVLAGQHHAAQQHTRAQQQRPLQAASPAAASYLSAAPLPQPRQVTNLAAAAAAPPPAHVAAAAQLTSGVRRSGLSSAAAPHASQQQQRRRYAGAAAAPAQTAVDVEYDGSDPVGVGSLLEFERGQGYLVGRAIKQLAQGWQVEVPSGTVYSVKQPDVKFVLPGGPGYSASHLQRIAEAAAELAAQDDLLPVAWEVASEGGAFPVFTVPQMAEFLFNRVDPAACVATLRLLRDDRLYFKQAGRSPPMFSPRSEADVQSLQASLRKQAEAEASWARFAADIQAAQQQPRARKPGEGAWRAGPHAARLAALEALALGDLPPVGEQYQLASGTLARLGKTPSSQDAAELLQSIGWWEPHLQLNLLSAGVTERFPPELEAEAQQLLAAPPPDPDADRRRDLTSHTVFTIDDTSTTEIDDGLSLERLPDGGLKVWVHIADPSRWVPPASGLAQEAANRSKSLYLPTGVIPMFPKCLAEGPFSLRAGTPTAAISVGAQLGEDGALLADSVEVVPSTVAPTRRLTYVDADGIYEHCSEEEERDLFQLLQVAEQRRQHRLASGATEILMPESCVSVEGAHTEEPEVTIEEECQHESPSRQMVAEMMVLAGEAVGELGRCLAVPLPYRGQAEPVLPGQEELEAVPPGPCQAVLLRQRMTRSVTTTAAPVRHAGLGLEAYVQFTSPIRRYGDLLAHWQLKAALRGEQPPLGTDELADVMDSVTATQQRLSKLERETKSYWVAEYFRQIAEAVPRATWGATFLCWLKQDVGLGRVLLNRLGLETVVRFNSPVQPGDELFLRCSQTDVRMGMWRLEPVPHSQVSLQHLVNPEPYL
ncbi:hypothetical protein ABPG75_009707 [Micractinium tetrahymenae]